MDSPLSPASAPDLALLAELNPQQWALWRQHPVSKVLLRDLGDYGRELRRRVLEDWEAGRLTLAEEQERRGRLGCLSDVLGLSLDDVREFYGTNDAKST